MLIEIPLARIGSLFGAALLAPGAFAAIDDTTRVSSSFAIAGVAIGLASTWMLTVIFTPDGPVDGEARSYVLRSVAGVVFLGSLLAVEAGAHAFAAPAPMPVRAVGAIAGLLLAGLVVRCIARTRAEWRSAAG